MTDITSIPSDIMDLVAGPDGAEALREWAKGMPLSEVYLHMAHRLEFMAVEVALSGAGVVSYSVGGESVSRSLRDLRDLATHMRSMSSKESGGSFVYMQQSF